MQNKFLALFAVAAAFALNAPASATSISVSGAGVLNNPFSDLQATFDTVPGAPQTYGNLGPAFGPFTDNGANFSGGAMIMFNTPGGTGSSLGLYAEPLHDITNYLTVQPAGSSETIALNAKYFHFGLYWGSVDTYNSLEFFRGATLLDTITGTIAAGAVPAAATGDQLGDQNNRYFEFTNIGDGLGFDSVVLASTEKSFEVDNLSWGPAQETFPTPLPAALPLFLSGLSGLGFMSFLRKKRAVKVATA